MTRVRLAIFSIFLALALLGGFACVHLGFGRSAAEVPAPRRYEPVRGLGAEDLKLPAPTGDGFRLLLDARALDRLKESARSKTRSFEFVMARADETVQKSVDSGYQGFEWADAVANTSLAWH